MPLDRIYVTRHALRMNWNLDHTTGTYWSMFPTPTGIPVDPVLTAAGVRQSHELAAHLDSGDLGGPRPWRVYCSPFYRCLQTIAPGVEALMNRQKRDAVDDGQDLLVRIENGLGDWFGSSDFFEHPSAPTLADLYPHFPTIFPSPSQATSSRQHCITPPRSGESIAQLHDRLAVALEGIIAEVDAECAAYEAGKDDDSRNSSKSLLICSHAAPIIAIGRALTGAMPEDTSVEDFRPFTAGLSLFVRRRPGDSKGVIHGQARQTGHVPSWRGRGVSGGWDCVRNGDCSFLSQGEERGWHFNGEEDFLSMPAGEAGRLDPSKL